MLPPLLVPDAYEIWAGGWLLVSRGSDPFGDGTRHLSLEDGLAACAKAGITAVSFHDRDLYPDDADPIVIEARLRTVMSWMNTNRLAVANFTTNLFSNPAFRSGAFSSPYRKVREAAIIKACRAIDIAASLKAKNLIFWGGREGQDGAYEQDPGTGLGRYFEGLRFCVDYALERGYDLNFTIEPKVYEPRLLGLYAGTGASAASAIRHFFPQELYGNRVRVNPEYPQHTMQVGLDPVIELGQLLEEGMLADFIHFGGQIPGRMDCDMAPGLGGSSMTDFMICYLLHSRGWRGAIELDCRPLPTTTTKEGMLLFLRHAVNYWHMLEQRVTVYLSDPIMSKIRAEIDGDNAQNASARWQGDSKLTALQNMLKSFTGFDHVAAINTDAIEAHAYRLIQIMTGTEREGAQIFADTRWAA